MQENTKLLNQEGGIEHAALTMAVGVITQRVQRLPKEDKNELYELLKEFITAESDDDRDSIIGAVLEILDQEPGVGKRMDPADGGPLKPGLRTWIDFVSRRIRELRKTAGLTQEALAEKSGLPQPHISRLERGEHSPSRVTLEKLAGALGVPLSELDPSA